MHSDAQMAEISKLQRIEDYHSMRMHIDTSFQYFAFPCFNTHKYNFCFKGSFFLSLPAITMLNNERQCFAWPVVVVAFSHVLVSSLAVETVFS